MKNKSHELFLISALEASIDACVEILKIYTTNFDVENKLDDSPVTLADKNADDVIRENLASSSIKIISEEGETISYDERKNESYIWIVDPLDGTKEFVKRNGEFTVNIALIKNEKPVLGIIALPTTKEIYWGTNELGSHYIKIQDWDKKFISEILHTSVKIESMLDETNLKIVTSRSHRDSTSDEKIQALKNSYSNASIIYSGSSIKFCDIAIGRASIYPRYTPINEWDIAAGVALILFAGGSVLHEDGSELKFNQENLKVKPFICRGK